MSDRSRFDKDIELLKITLLSEELRVRAFTKIGLWLSIFIATIAGDLTLLNVTDRVEVAVLGLAFTFGLGYAFMRVRNISVDYRKQLARLDTQIKTVEAGENIGDFGELLKKFIDSN